MALFNWWNRERPAFHDRAFQRANLPQWDTRWQTLSVAARKAFLDNIKVTRSDYQQRKGQPPVSAACFPSPTRDELVSAGFMTLLEPIGREKTQQVMLVDKAVDFVNWLRALRRYHLLDAQQPSEFTKYVNYCFAKHELTNEINRILQKAGLPAYTLYGDVYELYVLRHRWPGWVTAYLEDSLAQSILNAIEQAGGGLPLLEVACRLPRHKPADVRAMLEKLVTRLVLFEDLDPETYEFQVGLLPSMRAERAEASKPRQRPPLEPCSQPREIGPEGGTDIPDLRAVLLELASGRARLRQDRTLFQKETERFASVLEPLPDWLATMYNLTLERRLDIALHWATRLQMTSNSEQDGHVWLALSKGGQDWLARRSEQQYAFIYESLRDSRGAIDSHEYWRYDYDDGWFLGTPVIAVAKKAGRQKVGEFMIEFTSSQRQALREALHAVFRQLPVGVLHRLDNFVAHASFGSHNPLLLGRKPEEVHVQISGRILPPMEEQYQEAARHLLRQLISNRLVSLGCLQTGLDADGELLIARQPRLDVYFGDEPEEEPDDAPSSTRVVVQPDFSVIVIGLDLSPVAELAPFCDRVKERGSVGTMTFRITRPSIIRAVTTGLSGEKILDRLQAHSSTPLPGNVTHEIREWSSWVRSVATESATIFRCPDAISADRVVAALGRRAEKLNETTVAFSNATLGESDRRKLLEQGILLGQVMPATPAQKDRKKRR